jgi:gliding motility-associated-like protein
VYFYHADNAMKHFASTVYCYDTKRFMILQIPALHRANVKFLAPTFISVFILLNTAFVFSQTVTFNYTGAVQNWTVPPCVTSITVTARGADGGGNTGGNGAQVTGTLAVTPGQILQIRVGGSGACPTSGYNGGGSGTNANSFANSSCGGGGATDLRIAPYALANRVIVAAGGGGMGGGTSDAAGGGGGCANGITGTSPFGVGGGAASQFLGGNGGPAWAAPGSPGQAGSIGQGGNGGANSCYNNAPGGGGGGGLFGGGGGGADCWSSGTVGGGGGGGGSSLTPAGGACQQGINNGPGILTITYVAGTGTATATNSGPYCAGATIQLNATGTGTFSWTGPNGFTSSLQNPTIPNATTANAGVYNLTVTATGCTATATTTVVVNTVPTVNAGPDQSICQGNQVTLTATGATTYSWNNAIPNGVPFTQSVGTVNYIVTGTVGACSATDQVAVTVNALPTVNAGQDIAICNSSTVTLTASTSFTQAFSWNNGVVNGVPFSPTTTTTYTLTGTSPAGCLATDQVVVSVNALPFVNAGIDQTVCSGAAVTLSGSGANTYSWNNGVTNGTAFNPTATTTYTVTGTAANGCTNTDQVLVTVNPLPPVNAGPDQIICTGAAVTLTGNGAVSYSWNNGISNGVSFNPTATTTYTLTGTDGNNCVNTDQVLVTVNALPPVNAGTDQTVCLGTSVTLNGSGANTYSWNNGITNGVAFTPSVNTTYTVTGTDLNGCENTDQVLVTVNALPPVNAGIDQTVCFGTAVTLNGSGALTYTWNNNVSNGVSFTPTITGTYTVTGTDGNNCVNTDQVVVNVNALPLVNAGADQTICNGSAVTLNGSGALTYSWNNNVVNGVAFIPSATTTYTVTGTDANNCINTDQMVVTVNALPIVSAGQDQSVCAGTAVTLSGSGAVTYTWDNGVTNAVSFVPTVTTTYTVTGTAGNNCVSTDEVLVTINPLPLVDGGNDQIVCNGTSVTLTASGSATYSWDNGITNGIAFTPSVGTTVYTVTGVSGFNCVNTDQVSVTVNPLPLVSAGTDQTICIGTPVTLSGLGATTYTWDNAVVNGVPFNPSTTTTYTVIGTDLNGCLNTDQVQVTVNLLANVSAGADQTICNGSSVTLSGSGALTYLWDNGVNDGVPFSPSSTATYTVTGTDVNGCVNTDQVVVNVNALPPVNAGSDFSICLGDNATLTGAGAITYSWNNGVTDALAFSPTTTTTYTVTGTDANNCENTDQIIITVNALPSVNAGIDQTICTGAQVTLSGAGANTYTWNNGVTNALAFTPAATTTYTVTGTDLNGCQNTDQVLVSVNALPIVNAGTDAVVCIGGNVTLSGSGATTYTWDNGILNGVAFTPSATTTYTVTGTDLFGCQNTDQVIVTVNPLPLVDAGSDKTLCDGASVTLTATGATTYAWTPLITNGTAFTPSVGTTTYTVSGTDANGCINTDQVLVVTNALPAINAGTDQAICLGDAATLTGSGGTIYNWSNAVIDGTPFSPVATATYTVTGTDGNGCINTDQVVVAVNPLPTVNAGSDAIVCEGLPITVSATGAVTYSWNNGVLNGVSFTPANSGTYTVTGTDANGCEATDQLTITISPTPVVTFSADVTEGCIPLEVTFTNTGTVGVDCNWTISNGTVLSGCGPVSTVFNSGGCSDVTLSVTNNNGCIGSQTIADMICVEEMPIASFTSNPSDFSANDPQVNFQNGSIGAVSYLWSFGQNLGTSNQVDPTFDFSGQFSNQEVQLIAYSPLGCSDTAYAYVEFLDDILLYVPNTFTPDGDMFNQSFEPVFTSGFDPYNFSMYIFNRWGELVFETHNAEIGWDGTYGGKYVQDGTYSWKIEFKPKNTDDKLTRYGHVTIVR